MNKDMKQLFSVDESPCQSCPNRAGTLCTFYNKDLSDGSGDEADLMPCGQCEDDCTEEAE